MCPFENISEGWASNLLGWCGGWALGTEGWMGTVYVRTSWRLASGWCAWCVGDAGWLVSEKCVCARPLVGVDEACCEIVSCAMPSRPGRGRKIVLSDG